MAKLKEHFTVKFDLKHEIIAALKIAAAVKQVDPRDIVEELVLTYLMEYVALAKQNKPKE